MYVFYHEWSTLKILLIYSIIEFYESFTGHISFTISSLKVHSYLHKNLYYYIFWLSYSKRGKRRRQGERTREKDDGREERGREKETHRECQRDRIRL